jgi:hypothetical protein
MCLILVLSLCSAVVKRCGVASHFSRNSRLGEFDSRLGPNKFPFGRLRELALKGLIYLAVPGAKTALFGNNRKNSRLNGKNREFAPAGYSLSGTPASSSSSQTLAVASEGARQSPRGDSEPPEEILGPLGNAERLNWLSSKKR